MLNGEAWLARGRLIITPEINHTDGGTVAQLMVLPVDGADKGSERGASCFLSESCLFLRSDQ